MSDKAYIPHIQVRSNALVYYELPESPFHHRRHNISKYKGYSGTVTDHAAKRIKRTVDVFLQRSPERRVLNTVTGNWMDFRLNFVTLTVSAKQCVDAKESHAALKVFLQHFKQIPRKKAVSEQLRSYLWKCELQERGQIHYHLTTNSFMHLGHIRRVWNGIQFRRGWLDDYKAEHGHTDANSTDVHAVYKVRDIQAYLSKYLSKSGRKDVSEAGFPCATYLPCINGKIWDCSNDLKISRFADEMDSATDGLIRDGLARGEVRQLSFPRCEVFCTDRPTDYLSIPQFTDYQNWRK